jgi:1-pyrroline-5-carboxylate dehydrogenase
MEHFLRTPVTARRSKAAIVADLPPNHAQVREELFLPYLVVQKFKTLSEAVARANAIQYGLTAGFYGADSKDKYL